MMKALHNWLLLFFLFFSFGASAQLTVTPGTSLTVLPDTKLSLEQGVTIQNSAAFINNGFLFFKGNLINDGTALFSATARVVANGSNPQSINGKSAFTFPLFVLNNAAGITLNTPVAITDSLQLVNGIMHSSATSPLLFTSTATNPLETNDAYIAGQTIMEARAVATNPLYPFLGISAPAGADLGTVRIVRNSGMDAVKALNAGTSIAANWTIETSNPSSTIDRTISFSWLSALDNGKNTNQIDLYGSDTTYVRLSQQSADVSALHPRVFTQNSIGTLNRNFTFFDTTARFNVSFISLSGQHKGYGVHLYWITGTEINNKGFEIERSIDGVNFTKIGFMAGLNGPIKNAYEYLDGTRLKGRAVYYRLKQVYNNGNYQYSNILVVSLNGSSLYQFNVYPNPFNDFLKIDIEKEDTDPLTVRLINVSGSVVFEKQYIIGKKGQIQLTGLSPLPAGVYFISVANKNVFDAIKLIKSNN
jgi:hypothetical protein